MLNAAGQAGLGKDRRNGTRPSLSDPLESCRGSRGLRNIGDLPLLSDFAPATLNSDGNGGITRFVIGGTTTYDLANANITATPIVIPEPSSLMLLAAGLMVMSSRRRKK